MRSRLMQALRRRLALLAVAGAIVATTTVAAAPPAAASTDVSLHWGNDSGYFFAYGEHVKACDGEVDGYRVVVFYTIATTGTSGVVVDSNGANNGCVDRNLSLAEGTTISISLCHQNGASDDPFWCTGYYYGEA
jgi:hypothetical protein